jgi:hypothetical protein
MIPRDGGSGSTHSSAKPTRSISAPSLSTPTRHPVRKRSSSVGSRDRSRESDLPDKSKLKLGTHTKHKSKPPSDKSTSYRSVGTRDRSWKSDLPDKSKLHLGNGGEPRRPHHKGNSSGQSSSRSVGTRDRSWESGLPDKSKLKLGTHTKHKSKSSSRKSTSSGNVGTHDRSWESNLPDKSKLHLGNGGETRRRNHNSNSSHIRTGRRNLDHYTVELKAWIPQSEVVDPLATYNRVKDAPPGALPSGVVGADVDVKYRSRYRGDNHNGYDGSWKAKSSIEFDYDKSSKKITNLRVKDSDISTTHRDWHWDAYAQLQVGPFTPIEKKIASDTGTEAGRGSGKVYGRQSGSDGFSLGFIATNRVQDRKIPGRYDTPSIDSDLDGSFSADGKTMTLKYDTDLFPSHGFQVSKNGNVIATDITNDASGVDVSGGDGAANIGYRLSRQSNEGESQISIG